MRLVRWTHSCIRLEQDGGVLVIDPGIWSEPEALRGADAVLLTHHHSDHADLLRLRGLGAPVFAPADAVLPELDIVGVRAGDAFSAGGFRVSAVGGLHAPVLATQASCANLGYIVNDGVYHPGDALHIPEAPVETLLVALQAAWLKTAEAIEFVRAVAPVRAVGVHDGQVNERALTSLNYWMAHHSGTDYRWLAPGATA